MNLKSFRESIAAARQRYEAFHDDGALLPRGEMLQELGTTLEELQVASEEIHSQSDRLALLQEVSESITRRFRDHFELAPLAYLVTDRDGMIRNANQAAEALFGRTTASLARLPIVALASATERLALRARIVRIQGEPAHEPVHWDLWLRNASRGPFEATVWVSRKRRLGEDAEDLRWVVLRRPTMPATTSESEHLPVVLAETTEDVADGILLATPRGSPLWWNSAFLAASGIAASDLVSRGVVECLSERVAEPEHVAARARELEGATTPAPPELIRLRDGRTVALGVCARRLDGTVVGHSWTLRDVTDGVEARDLAAKLGRAEATIADLRRVCERADTDKARLIGALAHEIRNPMNALRGAAAIVGKTTLSDEQARFMAMIERSGSTVLEIVRSVLDLAQVQSGQGGIASLEFDLADVVESTVRSACADPHAEGIDVDCRIDPALPRRVTGDPYRLGQIVGNLLGNALKFTEQGGVMVALSPDTEAGRPDLVAVAVSDTGPGIEPERLGTIFDPFGPGGVARQRHGGTGLGLSITKELVERMGGSIRVESTLGRGSGFTVRLPLPPATTQPSPSSPISRQRPRVLVGDVREASRRSIAETLRLWNVDVVEGADADAVMRFVESNADDVRMLILDVRLAGQDDFALLERLRERAGVVERTLVVLPVRHRRADISRLDELGAGGWILRPYRQSELHDLVCGILDEKSI